MYSPKRHLTGDLDTFIVHLLLAPPFHVYSRHLHLTCDLDTLFFTCGLDTVIIRVLLTPSFHAWSQPLHCKCTLDTLIWRVFSMHLFHRKQHHLVVMYVSTIGESQNNTLTLQQRSSSFSSVITMYCWRFNPWFKRYTGLIADVSLRYVHSTRSNAKKSSINNGLTVILSKCLWIQSLVILNDTTENSCESIT